MAKPLADRVDALDARNTPARKWHKVITENGETGEQIRGSCPDIAPEDGLIIYRLI